MEGMDIYIHCNEVLNKVIGVTWHVNSCLIPL